MSSPSTHDQLLEIAQLAQLEVEETELPPLAADIRQLLALFDQLRAVDTSGVEPTAHALGRPAPLREDRQRASLDRDRVLQQAPRSEQAHFVVPPVIE